MPTYKELMLMPLSADRAISVIQDVNLKLFLSVNEDSGRWLNGSN